MVRCYGGFFTACVGLFVPGARHKKAVVVSYRYVRQRRDFRIARRAVLLRRNGAAAFNERKNRRRMQRNYGNAAFGRRGVLVGYVRGEYGGGYRLRQRGRFGACGKSDGRASCYKRIIHSLNGKTVYELSCSDISREFALKKKVEEQNEELRKMNVRLRKYGETVTEVTKERETLAARVKVHDGMGSLILKTKRALLQGEGDKEALIREWNGVVSFVSSPETEEDRAEEIKKTAKSVGVKILYTGVRPLKGSVAEKILANAVFECITNTARHADGDELYITVSDDGAFFTARIGNNGRPPKAEIVEGGGLSSLRRITEMAGGSMKTESFPRFLLYVSIPKGEKEDER